MSPPCDFCLGVQHGNRFTCPRCGRGLIHYLPLRAELAEYKEVFGHALACVDEVFQECCERPNPILKGYSIAGRCKFEEVKRLARDYVACRSLLREAHRIRAVRDICGTSWSETVKRVLAAKAGGTP